MDKLSKKSQTMSNEEILFKQYFGNPEKTRETSVFLLLSIRYGLFLVEIEKHENMGSIGFVKIGYSPSSMIIAFSTPNEQGISFEDCCKQIKSFLASQIEAMQPLQEKSIHYWFNQYVPIHCKAYNILPNEICITISGDNYTVISSDGFSVGGEYNDILADLKQAVENNTVLVNQEG